MSAPDAKPTLSDAALAALALQPVRNALILRRRIRQASAALAAIEHAMTPEERAGYKTALDEGVL